MSNFKHPVFVTIRPAAARMAGCWVREQLESNPSLTSQLRVKDLTFLLGLEKKGRKREEQKLSEYRLKEEREFLERVALEWRETFRRKAPELLLSAENPAELGEPKNGEAAMAEVIVCIRMALRRGSGAPEKLDPLETLGDSSGRTLDQCAERPNLDPDLPPFDDGVSVDAVKEAIRKGKITREAIAKYEQLMSKSPANTVGPALLIGTPKIITKRE